MHLFSKLVATMTVTLALVGAHLVIAAEPVPNQLAPTAIPAGDAAPPSGDPADVVVRVNGVAILRAELERNMRPLLAKFGSAVALAPEQSHASKRLQKKT